MATNLASQAYRVFPLQGGLIQAESPHLLPPGAFSGGQNFVAASAIRRSASAKVLGTLDLGISPRFILPATREAQNLAIIGCDDRVLAWDGSIFTDITPEETVLNGTAADRWTGGVLHGVVVLNNGVDAPMGWVGDKLTFLDWDDEDTWDDKGWRAFAMRPFKNLLVAFGYEDDTQEYRQTVYWSAIADPNTLPPSWDYADLGNLSGFQPLAERDGRLIDGLILRDSMIVYSQNSIHRMSFTPQDLQQIMTFDGVSMTAGMIAPGCAVEVSGNHVVLTSDDVVLHDGQSIRSLVDRRLRTEIMQSIDPAFFGQCRVVKNSAQSEVWICVPSAGSEDGSLDIAWVWNSRDDEWSKKILPQHTRDLAEAVIPSAVEGDTWESDEEGWETDDSPWGSSFFLPTTLRVLAVNDPPAEDFNAYVLEHGQTFADVYQNEQQAESYVERLGILLDGEESTRKRVTEVTLTAEGGSVIVEVGAAESPHGPYRWSRQEVWVPGVTRRLPFRSPSGIYHSIRLTFQDKLATEVVGYTMSYVLQGVR